MVNFFTNLEKSVVKKTVETVETKSPYFDNGEEMGRLAKIGPTQVGRTGRAFSEKM
jgi:hypothetical protein